MLRLDTGFRHCRRTSRGYDVQVIFGFICVIVGVFLLRKYDKDKKKEKIS